MLGLALCESLARPGACIVPPLDRLGAMDGVEDAGGKPYCCWYCVCPGVGIEGISDVALGPGSAIYTRPLEGKKGDCCASMVAGPPLPALTARAEGDLGVKIRRGAIV